MGLVKLSGASRGILEQSGQRCILDVDQRLDGSIPGAFGELVSGAEGAANVALRSGILARQEDACECKLSEGLQALNMPLLAEGNGAFCALSCPLGLPRLRQRVGKTRQQPRLHVHCFACLEDAQCLLEMIRCCLRLAPQLVSQPHRVVTVHEQQPCAVALREAERLASVA